MPGIDESRPFVPLKIAVLTVSDTRVLADDKSGATLAERIEQTGHAVGARAIVTDDVEKIRAQVKVWIADPSIDVMSNFMTVTLPSPLRPARLREPPHEFGTCRGSARPSAAASSRRRAP